MEIITSHTNADFDALASMVAAKKLYPGARLVFPGSQEKSMRDFSSNPRSMPEVRPPQSIDGPLRRTPRHR
jgi:nanoRNase/pAp phosphatase (c-di-AMP/oligoRNAs hydrolase)